MVVAPRNEERMYRLLQVSPEATVQQIRRAYRKLAHDTHPDTHPEDPEASRRFQEITEAFELLSSPERRARYDYRRGANTSPAATIRTRRAVVAEPSFSRSAGWVVTDRPTILAAEPVSMGSVPLVAGPVRISPCSDTADHIPATSVQVARLIEAIREVWRLR